MDSPNRAFAAASAASALVVAAFYLFEPVPLALVVAGMAVLSLIALREPLATLALVAATLPLYHRPLDAAGQMIAPSELLLLASLTGTAGLLALNLLRWRVDIPGYLERLIAGSKAQPMRRYIWAVMLALMAVVGLALLAGVDDPDARAAGLREWRWTLAEPLLFLGLLFVHASGPRACVLVAGGYGAGALGVAAWGLADGLLGQGVAAGGVLRVDGPFPHPNAYALYLLRPVVAAAALALLLRVRSPFVWGLIGVVAAALLASFARSAMLGLLVAGLLMLPWLSRRARVVACALAIGGVALLVAVAGERMVGTSGTDSLALREDIWRAGLAMIRDRPLTGYGPDQFLYVYTPRYIDPAAWAERFTSHGHNLLIDAWVRIGIIGAVFVLLAVGAIARGAVRSARDLARSGPLATAAIIALAAALAQGMVDNGYFVHDLAMSAWLLAWLSFEGPEHCRPRGA